MVTAEGDHIGAGPNMVTTDHVRTAPEMIPPDHVMGAHRLASQGREADAAIMLRGPVTWCPTRRNFLGVQDLSRRRERFRPIHGNPALDHPALVAPRHYNPHDPDHRHIFGYVVSISGRRVATATTGGASHACPLRKAPGVPREASTTPDLLTHRPRVANASPRASQTPGSGLAALLLTERPMGLEVCSDFAIAFMQARSVRPTRLAASRTVRPRSSH